MILTLDSCTPTPQCPGAWGVGAAARGDFMLSYFFDTIGYLSDSGLLSDFFSISAIAVTIAICRKMFSKGV